MCTTTPSNMGSYTNHCQYLFVNGCRVIFMCLEDKAIINKQCNFLNWIGNYYWSYSSWKLEGDLKCFQQAKSRFHASSKSPTVPPKPVLPLQKHILYICCTTNNTFFFSETHRHCVTMAPKSPSFQFCSVWGAGNGVVHTRLQRDLFSSFQQTL